MKTDVSSHRRLKLVQISLQGLVAIVFIAAGTLNLTGMMAEEMMRLGYPDYFSKIIGVAFIISVICIYQPRLAFLKDWAFGAMAATLVGAAGTHILIGDPISRAAPAIVTLIALLFAHAIREQTRQG